MCFQSYHRFAEPSSGIGKQIRQYPRGVASLTDQCARSSTACFSWDHQLGWSQPFESELQTTIARVFVKMSITTAMATAQRTKTDMRKHASLTHRAFPLFAFLSLSSRSSSIVSRKPCFSPKMANTPRQLLAVSQKMTGKRLQAFGTTIAPETSTHSFLALFSKAHQTTYQYAQHHLLPFLCLRTCIMFPDHLRWHWS